MPKRRRRDGSSTRVLIVNPDADKARAKAMKYMAQSKEPQDTPRSGEAVAVQAEKSGPGHYRWDRDIIVQIPKKQIFDKKKKKKKSPILELAIVRGKRNGRR